MVQILFIVTILSLFSWSLANFQARLVAGLNATDLALQKLRDRWQIDKYPKFLKSVAMTTTAWEVLKLKYEKKIIQSILSSEDGNHQDIKFIISFLGSSVTAGHDTPFELTFSELTEVYLKPAFDSLKITVETRNGAMGNNPCVSLSILLLISSILFIVFQNLFVIFVKLYLFSFILTYLFIDAI